jgi:hypothetical protein
MYDFYFTNKKNIKKDPEKFLIFVKRLLPRWVNGIPDTECLAIFKLLEKLNKKNKKRLVLLETGCGASTIAMYLHCAIYGGKMFSWDTNASKGSFLRSVILESIDKVLESSVNKIWTFIPYDSTDQNVGLEVLKELKIKADFCFFDSLHTLNHLIKEVKCFEKVSSKKFILALDDAYYRKKNKNYSYLNMIRKKINLKEVTEPKKNICLPFYLELKKYLKQKYLKVILEDNYYKKNYKNDIFFDYYSSDRIFLNKMGMEEKNKLKNRFEALYVEK